MLLRALSLAILLSSQACLSAPLNWSDSKYSHFSDEEPLGEMLKTLAANEETPIVVSPMVKDIVSMHYRDQTPRFIFDDLAKTYGLIWYYDGETLYVYKEDEAQRGSISLEKMKPREFTTALERLGILDGQFHWEVSEIDNMIYFNGPERFVSAVLDMAKLMENQSPQRTQIYKWVDAKGRVNYSNEKPVQTLQAGTDITTQERFPGFDVVDVIKR
ncbi:MAG TPA: DUF4124 domain-containing protein [Thiolinea sp.]|nr:DUF4124 domain-containing protein [Thiolinea sp.]